MLEKALETLKLVSEGKKDNLPLTIETASFIVLAHFEDAQKEIDYLKLELRNMSYRCID